HLLTISFGIALQECLPIRKTVGITVMLMAGWVVRFPVFGVVLSSLVAITVSGVSLLRSRISHCDGSIPVRPPRVPARIVHPMEIRSRIPINVSALCISRRCADANQKQNRNERPCNQSLDTT